MPVASSLQDVQLSLPADLQQELLPRSADLLHRTAYVPDVPPRLQSAEGLREMLPAQVSQHVRAVRLPVGRPDGNGMHQGVGRSCPDRRQAQATGRN